MMHDPRDVREEDPTSVPVTSPVVAFLLLILGAIALVLVIAGLIVAWHTFVAAAEVLVQGLVALTAIAVPATLIGFALQRGYLGWAHMKRIRIGVQQAEEELQARLAERRRADERHALELHLARTRLPADKRGNRAFIFDERSGRVIEVRGGNYIANVPAHYAPRLEYRDSSLPGAGGRQPLVPADLTRLHVPTLGELIDEGIVGPGQRDMHFCFEIVLDEERAQPTLCPVRGAISELHTQLILAGSGSGKTTYMATIIAQAAALDALFYIFDPHLVHPEKSVTAKLQGYQGRCIVPPAGWESEAIRHTLEHARMIRDMRVRGRPTPYDGHHIMVVVDELPALMSLQRDKRTRQLGLELAEFMKSLGTQTAKFGITGLYASQFATKDELGEIDIRDACMSTLVMKLPVVQAQALRQLPKASMEEVSRLKPGHGFLMLSADPDPRRVVSSNASLADLSRLAALLPPSPLEPAAHSSQPVILSQQQDTDATFAPRNRPETGVKGAGNQPGNWVAPALQAEVAALGWEEADFLAKVDQVATMLGQDKTRIIELVWGVKPGGSKEYRQAEKTYQLTMAQIRADQEHYRRERQAH